MRRNATIFGIVLCGLMIQSPLDMLAQDVSYTQYYLNLAGQNPGFTGIEDYGDLKLGFRQGWNDFGVKNDNFYASLYMPIGTGQRLALKRNSVRVSNVPAYEKSQSDKRLRRRQGLGGMMTQRNVGPYKSSNVAINYSYHLPVSRTLTWSFGSRVGYGSQQINFNGYTVRDEVNDTFYQQLIHSGPGTMNSLSIDFGSVLYSRKFYLAVTSANLVEKDFAGGGLWSITNKRQYISQAAYTAWLGPMLEWNTGAKVTVVPGYVSGWAVNSRFRYKRFIYIGSAYDHVSKVSLLFGVTSGNFNLNYSYDHYMNNAGSLNVSVHELVLGLNLVNKYGSSTRLW